MSAGGNRSSAENRPLSDREQRVRAAYRIHQLTETVVRCTVPSEKTVTKSSAVPLETVVPAPVIGCVRQYSVASGSCFGRVEWTSREHQSEKKSGSSITQPQILKTPSTVCVKRTGPELTAEGTSQGNEGRFPSTPNQHSLLHCVTRSPGDAAYSSSMSGSRPELYSILSTRLFRQDVAEQHGRAHLVPRKNVR